MVCVCGVGDGCDHVVLCSCVSCAVYVLCVCVSGVWYAKNVDACVWGVCVGCSKYKHVNPGVSVVCVQMVWVWVCGVTVVCSCVSCANVNVLCVMCEANVSNGHATCVSACVSNGQA